MSSRDLWFITPLQAIAVIGTAANFGGSALQTPLTMPTLLLQQVPVQHSAAQLKYILHESEKYFPPLNMLCTISNIVVAITAYRSKDTSPTAAAKLPYAVAGAALNIATTVWALTIMVPRNRSMARSADALDSNPNNETAAKSLRQTLEKWRLLNLGRAAFMISASIVSLLGLLEDGSVVKI